MKTLRTLSLMAIAAGAMAFSTNASAYSSKESETCHEGEVGCVHFKLNSDRITPDEYEHVEDIAAMMQQNPDIELTITGYADKGTGTPVWNHAMSERRATAVAEELEYTFGIDPDRLTVEFDGSDIQPYDINSMNRAVIFTMR